MRVIFLALVFVVVGMGQICPLTPTVDIIDSKYMHNYFTLGSGHSANGYRIGFGTATSIALKSTRLGVTSTRTLMDYDITNLVPATKYYFSWEITDDGGSTYYDYVDCQTEMCPSGAGAQPGGYDCEDIGAGVLLPFITTAAGSDAIEPPIAPVHANSYDTLPTITGSTFTVDASCNDMQAQLDACAAASTALNHEVLIPAATKCRPNMETSPLLSYTLDTKIGAGYCVVRCADYASNNIPPSGVTPTREYYDRMCGLQYNEDANNSQRALIRDNGVDNNSQGWIFDRISIGAPELTDMDQMTIAVSAFDSATGVITTASPHGLSTFDAIRVDLPGIEQASAHLGYEFPVVTGASTIDVGGPFTGTYSGGGFISSGSATAITSCTTAVEPVCTTASAHGSGNFFEYTLTSVVSGTFTLSTSHVINAGISVRITGSTAGACDGIWTVATVNQGAGTGTITGTPDCTGGTLTQTPLARITGLSGISLDGEVYIVTYPSGSSVQLLRDWTNTTVDFSAAGSVTGGLFMRNSIALPRMMNIDQADRVVANGVIFYAPDPWRSMGVASFGAGGVGTENAVINSWTNANSFWFLEYPGIGVADRQNIYNTFNKIPSSFNGQWVDDVQILRNIEEEPTGWLWFTDDGTDTGCPSDISVNQNVHYVSGAKRTGQTTTKGLAYNFRQPVEWKCIDRLQVYGNTIQYQPPIAVRQQTMLTEGVGFNGGVSFPRGDRDVDMQWNTVTDQASGFSIGGRLYTGNAPFFFASARIRTSNNFIAPNFLDNNGGPTGQSMETASAWGTGVFEGPFTQIGSATFDYEAKNNTYFARRVTYPVLERHGAGTTKQTHVIEDNILAFSAYLSTSVYSGIVCDSTNITAVPTVTINKYDDCYKNVLNRDGSADTSSNWDNVILALLPNSAVDSFSSSNNMVSFAQTELACTGPCPGNFTNTYVGSDGQTPNERLDIAFETDSWEPKAAFSGKGVSIAELARQQGRITNITALRTSSTISLEVEAPATSTICWIDYTTNDKVVSGYTIGDFSNGALVNRVSLPTGSTTRLTSLNSLTANTTYYYKAMCGVHTVHGEVTTLP